MPYGLFDFEDTIQPMGLSPAYEPQWDSEAFYNVQNRINNTLQRPVVTFGVGLAESSPPQQVTMASQGTYKYSTDQLGRSIREYVPLPQNTGTVTRAIPENAPTQSGIPATAQKLAYMGAENSPPQQVSTMAIPENPPSQSLPPAPVTAKIPENSTTPNPVMTLAIPEGGVTPTPPSGQCPTGYQSSNQSSNQPLSNINSNPYGLTAGQKIVGASTGKPFNVNQAGNVWTQIASAR